MMDSENAAPHLMGSGFTASSVRKPLQQVAANISTPYASKSASKFGDMGCSTSGGDLSTPAAGKKHSLTEKRNVLGNISNRKKPATHSHIASKKAGAVQDAERLAEVFGSSSLSVTSSKRGLLFGSSEADSPPPIEYATRRSTPTGPVGFDANLPEVERTIADLCQLPRTFGSPYVSKASTLLQQPPAMAEMPSPAMGFRSCSSRSAMLPQQHPRFNSTTAIGGSTAMAAHRVVPSASSFTFGASSAGTPPPMAPPEVELDPSSFVLAPCMDDDDEDSDMNMDLEDES